MKRFLRIVALAGCAALVAHCGPQESTERSKNPGTGTNSNGGDATANAGDACDKGFTTVTGIVGNRNVGFSAPITNGKYVAPNDTTPGWLTLTLDKGTILFQFMNSPVQGGTVAARGVVFRDKDDVTVGHCEDSVYAAQLALASDSATKGSFFLTGFYGHDGTACDQQPVAGTLAGCFYY